MHQGRSPASDEKVPGPLTCNGPGPPPSGATVLFRRERPKLFLARDGVPRYLYNGVQPEGNDRVYTLVAPIMDPGYPPPPAHTSTVPATQLKLGNQTLTTSVNQTWTSTGCVYEYERRQRGLSFGQRGSNPMEMGWTCAGLAIHHRLARGLRLSDAAAEGLEE